MSSKPIDEDVLLAQAMAHLVTLFPSIDEKYLAQCVQHYDPNTSAEERVARVAEKIVALNHGYYPTIVPDQQNTFATASSSLPSSPVPSSESSLTRRSSSSGSWSLFLSSPSPTPPTPPPPSFTPTPINPTATKNAHLRVLSNLFPAIDPAHLRLIIDQHPTNTLLAATDALLSTPRHRLPRRDTFASPLTRADLFKSPDYIRGARARLYNSFPRLWKSSIKAYFAENALDYVATYLVLSELPDNSPGLFDAVVNTLFKRPRQADPAMYDPELLADVDRLERALARKQARLDRMLAWEVNRKEAISEGHLVECACCLDDVPWEEAVGCLAAEVGSWPHVVCLTCVRRGVQEFVFGQAGKVGDGGLRCFAPGEGCAAGYADEDVLRAIRADPKGAVGSDTATDDEDKAEDTGSLPITFTRYVLIRAKSAATNAGLTVNECPFCAHFTVSDAQQPSLLHVAIPNNNQFVQRCLTQLLTWTSQLVTWLNPFPTLLASPTSVIRPLLAAHFGHQHAQPPAIVPAHLLLDLRATLTLRWVVSMLSIHTLLSLLHVPPLLISCTHIAGLVRIAQLLYHVDVARRLYRAGGGGMGGRAEGARELATTTKGQQETLPSQVQVSTCASSACGRSMCLTCRGEWVPYHRCYEDAEEQSLETAVELAMSRAIKRVCPSCYLQFTKSDGCNLMTCPQCKYIMCYVCRREIDLREKYQHFCQHFRVHGGKCRECTRCELFASENEADVRQRAGKRALEEWLARHPRHGLSADEVNRVRQLVSK